MTEACPSKEDIVEAEVAEFAENPNLPAVCRLRGEEGRARGSHESEAVPGKGGSEGGADEADVFAGDVMEDGAIGCVMTGDAPERGYRDETVSGWRSAFRRNRSMRSFSGRLITPEGWTPTMGCDSM